MLMKFLPENYVLKNEEVSHQVTSSSLFGDLVGHDIHGLILGSRLQEDYPVHTISRIWCCGRNEGTVAPNGYPLSGTINLPHLALKHELFSEVAAAGAWFASV